MDDVNAEGDGKFVHPPSEMFIMTQKSLKEFGLKTNGVHPIKTKKFRKLIRQLQKLEKEEIAIINRKEKAVGRYKVEKNVRT